MKKRLGDKACQTSTIAHPGHAPEGKTATNGVEIITTLYTAAASKKQPNRHPFGQGESKRYQVPRRRRDTRFEKIFTLGRRGFSFINQGGLHTSCKEYRVGRIL
ncbi:hypothetical protein F5Y01DRAFT_294305 [Xylaria sp. FL0043]|nr:hypothetical protein F5Y01DRAFT_294305 [Xylaria sp. FL0043]